MYDLYVFLNSQDLSHLKEGVPCDVLSYCDHEDMVCQETVQEKWSNIIILLGCTRFSLRQIPNNLFQTLAHLALSQLKVYTAVDASWRCSC